jgi:prefoldin alpha subunit
LTSGVDKPILVPLTNSLYVPGKLADAERVLVDVGTGYFVKKAGRITRPDFILRCLQTRPQAVKYYEAKVDFIKSNLDTLQETIQKRQDNLGSVNNLIQAKLQAQAQSTQVAK